MTIAEFALMVAGSFAVTFASMSFILNAFVLSFPKIPSSPSSNGPVHIASALARSRDWARRSEMWPSEESIPWRPFARRRNENGRYGQCGMIKTQTVTTKLTTRKPKCLPLPARNESIPKSLQRNPRKESDVKVS
jgi:hypothetical protein